MQKELLEDDWDEHQTALMTAVRQHAEARPEWDERPALQLMFKSPDNGVSLVDVNVPEHVWDVMPPELMLLMMGSKAQELVENIILVENPAGFPGMYAGIAFRTEMYVLSSSWGPAAEKISLEIRQGKDIQIKDIPFRVEIRHIAFVTTNDSYGTISRARDYGDQALLSKDTILVGPPEFQLGKNEAIELGLRSLNEVLADRLLKTKTE